MSHLSHVAGVTVFQVDRQYDSLDEVKVGEFSALLMDAVEGAPHPLLLLDLGDTTFIGSGFLGVLVRAWKRIRDRKGRMALCRVNPLCGEVLRASKLDTIWEIYSTRDEAQRALAEAG